MEWWNRKENYLQGTDSVMSRNATNVFLHNAKKSKKDEFYTQLSDIERELKHYRKHFKDKVVYCNCDDPRVSNFFRYFSYNFEKLELKKLITTCYKNQNRDLFSTHDSERAIYLEYEGDKNQNNIPDPEEIGIRQLQRDGDFRSQESIGLLKQSDVVVTNPPFSLFREYVAQLIEHDKKFLIVGTWNVITYKEIFPLVKGNKIWIGVNSNRNFSGFIVPKHYPMHGTEARIDEDGNRIVSTNNTCWFTNLDIAKRHEELILYKRYSPEEYPTYDNYNAIEVSKTNDIPINYKGVMGVPITFMNKYNPDQFEILGATQRGCHDEVPDTKKYDDYWEVKQNGQKTGASGGKTNENANLIGNDGKKNYFINKDGRVIQSAYQRIFIRHKVL